MALIVKDFKDATKEMDGQRLFQLWKIKTLYFKSSGKNKYALEGLYFLSMPYSVHRKLTGSYGIEGSTPKEAKGTIYH